MLQDLVNLVHPKMTCEKVYHTAWFVDSTEYVAIARLKYTALSTHCDGWHSTV